MSGGSDVLAQNWIRYSFFPAWRKLEIEVTDRDLEEQHSQGIHVRQGTGCIAGV